MRERLRKVIKDSPLGIMEIERRSGIARCNIYQYLNGDRADIGCDKLRRLCRVLRVSADYILGLEPYERKESQDGQGTTNED